MPKPGWWDRLYKDQDADLDTYTGHVLTVPAGGGPVPIEVQKGPEPKEPEPDETTAEEPAAHPQVLDAPKPQPTLQIRTQPVKRSRFSRFWRVITFNGTAAAAGSVIGLNVYLSQFPEHAVAAAGGLVGSVTAITGGFLAWKVVSRRDVAPIVPFGFMGQATAVLGASEVGRRLGPAALPETSAAMAQHTGLTQMDTALVIVGLAMCGGSGWLVWHTRSATLLKRWFARIPLATSLLVCALYSNGPVI
ncbi:hypothetical protein [Streptomyces sp. NPDC002215]|uniref:hypothetical protein n=1 Tax=Streptomyces sp. NPDC002215 TaxID=3154412 RepID=UPI003317D6B1